MSTERVTISVPADLLHAARAQVEAGRSASMSALVSGALADQLRRQRMEQVLDEIEAEHGQPSREELKWARQALAED